ncbi:MAG: C40 family peptidase [Pseudomonadota bacterium]
MKKALLALTIILSGCGSVPPHSSHTHAPSRYKNIFAESQTRNQSPEAQEAVLYALGLLDIGYRFGGKNPDAGFDCSGMVTYVYNQTLGSHLTGSAADLAKRGTTIAPDNLLPGDLVFFNTMGKPFSHVGIYIGNNKFIHAPNSRSKVRVDRLDSDYFLTRFETAKSLFSAEYNKVVLN